MPNDFKKIEFGYASAESEAENSPRLVSEGYIDFDGAFKKANESHHFLFLGYKGSGKSSIAARFEDFSKKDNNTVVHSTLLGDFPFTPFSRVVRGDSEPESKFPLAWSWLLLIKIMHMVNGQVKVKNGTFSKSPLEFSKTIEALEAAGLHPSLDLAGIVRRAAKHKFRLNIPPYFDGSYEKDVVNIEAQEISGHVDSIRLLLQSIVTNKKFFLIIDGLDDIITKRFTQATALGALIFECDRINKWCKARSLNFKIILLCRTDMFERVNNANKNKIRQDSSVQLDWYHDPIHPENSQLVAAANLRASLSLGRACSIFEEYFPANIKDKKSATHLLDHTRHTPRDFLQLLRYMSNFYEGSKFTYSQIQSGIRDYSRNYFLPEIKDELIGYCDANEIEEIIAAFPRLGKREFSYSELEGVIEKSIIDGKRLKEVLEILFSCGAIGTETRRPDGQRIYSYKYRNWHDVFRTSDRIILHRGMWRALNLG